MPAKSRLVKSNLENRNIFAEEKHLCNNCSVHYHDFYEMDIIADGVGYTVFNGKIYDIKPGTVSFSTPEDFHEYITDSTVHFFTVQFTFDAVGTKIMETLGRITENVIYLDSDELSDVKALLDLLIKRAGNADYSSKLLECIIHAIKPKLEVNTTKRQKMPTPIQKSLIYIHSNFKDNIKMSEVACAHGLCQNYFSTLFHETVGVTYKDYIKNLRLSHARNLILYTDTPITQAALSSGYNSQSQFNRDFKNRYGTNPGYLRNNPQKTPDKRENP